MMEREYVVHPSAQYAWTCYDLQWWFLLPVTRQLTNDLEGL